MTERFRIKLANDCNTLSQGGCLAQGRQEQCVWRQGTKPTAKINRAASCAAAMGRASRPVTLAEVKEWERKQQQGLTDIPVLLRSVVDRKGRRRYVGHQPRGSVSSSVVDRPPLASFQPTVTFLTPEARRNILAAGITRDDMEKYFRETKDEVEKCTDPKFNRLRPYYAQSYSDEFNRPIKEEFYSNKQKLCEAIKLIGDREGQPETINSYLGSLDPDVRAWWSTFPQEGKVEEFGEEFGGGGEESGGEEEWKESESLTFAPEDFSEFVNEMDGDVEKCALAEHRGVREMYARNLAKNLGLPIDEEFYSDPRKLCQAIKLIQETGKGPMRDYLEASDSDVQAWWNKLMMRSSSSSSSSSSLSLASRPPPFSRDTVIYRGRESRRPAF